MALRIETRAGGTIVITLGPMLIAGDPAFKKIEAFSHQVAHYQPKLLIIDFAHCVYIDSRVISFILKINRRLQLSGAQLRLENANEEIRELLHAMQLNRIIEVC